MGRKLAAAMLVVASVAFVAASYASSTQRSERRENGESCVVDTTQPEESQVCYDSFSDAIYAVTDGEINLPRNADGNDLSNADVMAAQHSFSRRREEGDDLDREGRTISGVLWIDAIYNGDSRIFTGSNCRHGDKTDVPRLHARLFNDVASSAKGYSNCDANLFEHDDFGGAKLKCEQHCQHLGVLNDEVSSVRFKKND